VAPPPQRDKLALHQLTATPDSQNFLSCDRGQVLLLPPSLTDWLAEDHLLWTVLGAVDQTRLNRLYCAYRANGRGRAAYDPRMMARFAKRRLGPNSQVAYFSTGATGLVPREREFFGPVNGRIGVYGVGVKPG
jgi:hypothetical protein